VSGRRDISRRRFVALAGAGLAAVVTSAAAAAPATTKKKPAASHPAATSAKPAAAAGGGTQKEFDRQKASTLAVVKKLRAYPLPPGGDLPVVFKPMRAPKKGH
jgi:Rieske Fe-S protein